MRHVANEISYLAKYIEYFSFQRPKLGNYTSLVWIGVQDKFIYISRNKSRLMISYVCICYCIFLCKCKCVLGSWSSWAYGCSMFHDCLSLFFPSHPVWVRLPVRGFVPARSSLRSAQQCHRDQTGCQEVCDRAAQASRRTS